MGSISSLRQALGLHRVAEAGDRPGAVALPQAAWRLDPVPRAGPDEVLIRVDRLNLDAASYRQLREAHGGDPEKIRAAVLDIVATRGKMQNPVTGSGGMLTGTVEQAGPESPLGLRPGQRVATLVSLTLTPLSILDGLTRWDGRSEQIPCDGYAILFARSIAAVLPDDLPAELSLAVMDVCGAPALTHRVVAGVTRAIASRAQVPHTSLASSAAEAPLQAAPDALQALSATHGCDNQPPIAGWLSQPSVASAALGTADAAADVANVAGAALGAADVDVVDAAFGAAEAAVDGAGGFEGAAEAVRGDIAGVTVVVLGAAGKSGSLSAAAARAAGAARVIGVVPNDTEAALLREVSGLTGADNSKRRAPLTDVVVTVDARDPIALGEAVAAAGGPADVTVVCVDAPGCEGGAILATKQGGTVIFFSMATSFSAAALGAEGMAADVTMLIGNGYVPGHADLALDLLRASPAVRQLFERRLAR